MKIPHLSTVQKNQSGMVSIIVALVIMGILTLVTVSLALLTRREQRQALDRQLSTQAFYAAETGINDAVTTLQNDDIPGDGNITNCDDADQLGGNKILDPETSLVEYTCVLIDQSPTSYEKSPVGVDTPTIVPLRASENISKIRVSWENPQRRDETDTVDPKAATAEESLHHFLPQNDVPATEDSFVGSTGILRAGIIPVPAGNLNHQNLSQDAKTYFLYPNANGTAGIIGQRDGASGNGAFIDGECNALNTIETTDTPRFCNAEITGLSNRTVYLTLRGAYQEAAVTVQAFSSDGTALKLSGLQAVVDSTGRANDVLRRIQVRVPLGNSYRIPAFAIDSMESVCKRLAVYEDGAAIDQVPQTLNGTGEDKNAVDYNKDLDFGDGAVSGTAPCQTQ